MPQIKIPKCKKCPVCGSTRILKLPGSIKCKRCGYIFNRNLSGGFNTFEGNIK